jgi:hypothetical protein
MKLVYLKSALKSDSFDASICIKIPFSRVSVTVEPGHSLLTVRYHELFDSCNKFLIDQGIENVLNKYFFLFHPTDNLFNNQFDRRMLSIKKI